MNKKNLLTILIPALISIVIFFLPSAWQETLVLHINNLNWYSWFTFILVHQGVQHLVGNVIVYLIACFLAYFIFPNKDKEKFYKILLLAIIIVPLVTLILTLIFRNIGLFPLSLINNKGFSGVGAAAIGILGVAIARYYEFLWLEKPNNQLLLYLSYFFFIPSIGVMASNLSWKFLFAALLIWVVLIPMIMKVLKDNKIIIKRKPLWTWENLFILLGVCVLLFGSLMLIPANVIQNGSAVNTFAHFIGFIFGFWLAFFVLIEKKKLKIK